MTSILSNLNNYHLFEVVDRVSDTQLQVDENYSQIIWLLKGKRFVFAWSMITGATITLT